MKVSIIIPYNDDRGFLGEAVSSAEHQEGFKLGSDYEIIVQHGGTLGENVNEAIKKAKGEYIKILADDDLLAQGCLRDLYEFAIQGGYDFVCADSYTFEGKMKVIETVCSEIPYTVSKLAEGNTIHGGTILYRKSKFPTWDTSHWTAEEYAVTLQMAAAGCKFGKLDKVVYWYRSHAKQKSIIYRFSEDEKLAVKRIHYIRDEIAAPYLYNRSRIVR